jgi:SAM-dependent methyltransferase
MIPEHFEMIRRRREGFWWYVGRRDLFAAILRKHLPGPAPAGLDGGCGPGTNEALYAPFAHRWVCGDLDRESFNCWNPPSCGLGFLGDLVALPVRDVSVDLVLLLDVLEHMADDSPALEASLRVLKPGGLLLVSVPAFQALWSWHDEQAGHKRRYRLSEVVRLLGDSGFEVLDACYYNCILAAPIFLIRKVARRVSSMKSTIEADLSPGLFNGPFRAWLALENKLAFLGLRWPWGTTAVVWARKPEGCKDEGWKMKDEKKNLHPRPRHSPPSDLHRSF